MLCKVLAFVVGLGLLGVTAKSTSASEVIYQCIPEVVWTNPNPGTCVSVVIRISVQNPDSSVNVTTTGQSSQPEPINLGAGQEHHFLTRYDTITCHEQLTYQTIVWVID